MKLILELGLDGIEVYHPDHSIEYSSTLIEFCNNYKFIISGGSDYHGWKDSSEYIGSFGLDEITFDQFYNKCRNWLN